MRPSVMPKLSLRTLAIGARQLVVQDALETNLVPFTYASKLTPQTNIGVASLEGADITTYFAPASICACAFSSVKKSPVDSTTYSAWIASHLRSAGLRSAVTRILFPFTINKLFS